MVSSSIRGWLRATKPMRRTALLVVELLEDRSLPAVVIPVYTSTIDLSNSAVDEHQYSGALVGTFNPHLPGATGYTSLQLISGPGSTNNNLFSVAGYELLTTQMLSFQTEPTLSILVQGTASNGVTSQQAFTITVEEVFEAPTSISLSNQSVNERSPAGTVVGNISATGIEPGDSVTYSLISNGNGQFAINGSQLVVANGANLNFQNQQSYNVEIQATNSTGLTYDQNFQIAINQVPQPPTNITLSNASINEFSPAGSYVTYVSINDPNNFSTQPTLTLTNNANGAFYLNGNNLLVNDPTKLDADKTPTVSITLLATNAAGLTLSKSFTIIVNEATNPYEVPTDIALSNNSITFPAVTGATIGTFSATDLDQNQPFRYYLTTDPGGLFQINGNQLQITNPANFDNNPQPAYTITVQVQDSGGQSFSKNFMIAVNNVAQPPSSISLTNTSINEFSPTGSYVAYVSVSDPNNFPTPATLTLTNNANGAFVLNGNNLLVNDPTKLNADVTPTVSITLLATNADGLTLSKSFTITVNQAVNSYEVPTDITLSNATVSLPTTSGALVGVLSTVDLEQNQTFHYVLTNNAGGLFQINGSQLQVGNPSNFTYNPQAAYTVTVAVYDQGGRTVSKTFAIAVNDGQSGGSSQFAFTAYIDAYDTYTYAHAAYIAHTGSYAASNNAYSSFYYAYYAYYYNTIGNEAATEACAYYAYYYGYLAYYYAYQDYAVSGGTSANSYSAFVNGYYDWNYSYETARGL